MGNIFGCTNKIETHLILGTDTRSFGLRHKFKPYLKKYLHARIEWILGLSHLRAVACGGSSSGKANSHLFHTLRPMRESCHYQF